jgi:P27 family predicted phage terminase small subunit
VPISTSLIPPPWLDDDALAQWKILEPQVRRMGLLAEVDSLVLAGACCAAVMMETAYTDVRTRGQQVVGQKGNLVTNSSWRIFRDASQLLHRLGGDLGIGAGARASLGRPDNGEHDGEGWPELESLLS